MRGLAKVQGSVRRVDPSAICGAIALLVVLVLTFASARASALGELDSTFGDGGSVRIPLGFTAGAGDVAVQPDGRILLLGDAFDAAILLVRLMPGGALDPSFGEGGIVFEESPIGHLSSSLAIASDGRILVAGGAEDGVGVARLLADGSLDVTFGDLGFATAGPFTWPTCGMPGCWTNRHVMTLDTAGGILVTAATYDPELEASSISVIRFTREGILDLAFGDLGVASTPIEPGTADVPVGIAIADGGTITEGTIYVPVSRFPRSPWNPSIGLVAFRPTGAIKAQFGAAGFLEIPLDTWAWAGGALVQPDGRIVVGASAESPVDDRTHDAILARVLPSGRLDRSFGANGIARSPVQRGDWFFPRDVTLLADGSLFQVGRRRGCCGSPCLTYSYLGWKAYTPSGGRDARFADPPNVEHNIATVAVNAAGGILLATSTSTGCIQPPDGVRATMGVDRLVGPPAPSPRGRVLRPALPDRSRLPRLQR